MSLARARAHANIALVKYWGKRDSALNVPSAGSLSLTLEALTTETEVSFGNDTDRLSLDGEDVSGPALDRLRGWLDLIRAERADLGGAHVISTNNFPTASGLASSASAFAALALAASDAAGLSLDDTALSILARRGSGSAARSIFGGLVTMNAGSRDDGGDAYAEPLVSREALADWPLAMVIAVVGGGVKKSVSSRDAMEHCAETSPLHAGWLGSVPADLESARAAIERRDLDALGAICEASALAMHAAAMAARPAILYFQPTTLAAMARVRQLRDDDKIAAYYTMDAGPHVKVLTTTDETAAVARALAELDGVSDVIVSGVGGPARRIEPREAT